MSFGPTRLDEAERGHRRGVVLGFTLAELMLLLLFCLLLVSAGILTRKDEEIDTLKAALADKADVPVSALDLEAGSRLDKLMALIYPAGPPRLSTPEVDALWRELVLAKNAEDSLAGAGVDTTPAGIAALARQAEALKQAGLADAPPERLAELASAKPGTHDWPPIITLQDDGFSFARGSAEITPEFRSLLETRVADEVAKLLAGYDVDVVEIVGHTDEQVIHPTRPSNLDDTAIDAFWGRVPSNELVPDDNAGLGLARAIAVANALRDTGRLAGARFVPLSAAQLIAPGDTPSTGTGPADDQVRRRIEIRVRRAN